MDTSREMPFPPHVQPPGASAFAAPHDPVIPNNPISLRSQPISRVNANDHTTQDQYFSIPDTHLHFELALVRTAAAWNGIVTSRQLRNQRREDKRKPRKLEYQQNRTAAASAQEIGGAGSLTGEPVARPASSEPRSSALVVNPDLFDDSPPRSNSR